MNDNKPSMTLFWGCFIALIATAFGFIVRNQIIGDWGAQFNLTETQKGEIFGVGLWPFSISIVLFSLIIDRIGYKTAMIFGFLCHALSLVITVTATGYNQLYWGTFIVALGNGTVEAYINPVVATMYSKDKTKWLNILHAGWPGGMVLGGILAIALGASSWKFKVLLLAIPTIIYFFMLIRQKFPINERVAAGISYRDMLKEVGSVGMFIIAWMVFSEICRVFGWGANPVKTAAIIAAVIAVGFNMYVKSIGRPMFIFMLIIMAPLATTELGVDSWVTDLLQPAMGPWAKWLVVYTAAIMVVLRFNAGPIVHKLSPLGTLTVCAALACAGLVALSMAPSAGMVILAATLYGVGKTFFWPTTLGVVAEQFPRGGAMTLNSMGGFGMLSVGVIGAMMLGNIQDTTIDKALTVRDSTVHAQVTVAKKGLLGVYHAVDQIKLKAADEKARTVVSEVTAIAKKASLSRVAVLPAFMILCYLILIGFFRSRGGYKPVDINANAEAATMEQA